ncbi:hypothetical protein OUZ56_032633, partial [Daphnia magna]
MHPVQASSGPGAPEDEEDPDDDEEDDDDDGAPRATPPRPRRTIRAPTTTRSDDGDRKNRLLPTRARPARSRPRARKSANGRDSACGFTPTAACRFAISGRIRTCRSGCV